jgi:ABC-type glycerol-3-phosphate transport system substrate-binding protein
MLERRKQLCLMFLFLILLPSCRSSRNLVTTAPAGGASLILAVPDAVTDRYRALAAAFMEEHEGITVQVDSMSRLIGNDANSARALAQTADVFPAGFSGAWHSVTLDLTPFVEATGLDLADFPAGALYAADGAIRHLSAGIEPSFVLYNKALFDNAGLPYPTADWTWEEFVALATQLTQRYGDFTAQYGWADGVYAPAMVGAALAEPLVDYSGPEPAPRLAQGPVAAAAVRYLSLYGETGVAPAPRSAATAYGETQALIQDGRVAMWLGSYSFLSSYRSLDLGVLPLPVVAGNSERRLYLPAHGFSISAASQQPAAAWQLLEYLSRQPGFSENAMPARASARQASGFWHGVDPQLAELVENYADRGFALPVAERQALSRAVLSVLLEGTELSQALAAEEAVLAQTLAGEPEPLAAVPGSRSAPAEVERIVFITDGMHTHRHRVLAAAFEDENPDLRVFLAAPDWVSFSNIGFRTLDRAHNGQRADCFMYDPLTTEREVAQVLTLDALLELAPDLSREAFYPIALNAFLREGALIGLPYQFRMPHIGYDPGLFDAAGIPYPQPGWNLQDFLETAVALTGGEGRQKQYGYVPFQGEMIDFWIFLHAFDVNLIDASIEPPTARFDTAEVAEALRWYVALSETYGVKPVYRTNLYDLANLGRNAVNLAERRTIFATRRGAMWQDDGSESEGAYRTPTAAIEERRYTTFPLLPGAEAALPVEVTGLYISATTERRQACWRWFEFLLDHDPGIGIPARRSMAESEEFRLRAGPATTVMVESAERASRRQLAMPPEWMNLQGWYSVAVTRLLEKGVTAEEALASTQVEFERYRECVIAGNLFELTGGIARLRCAAAASPYVILGEE